MVADASSPRPNKGVAKRKGNQKSLRERRDVDIMNVRLPSLLGSAVMATGTRLTGAPDE